MLRQGADREISGKLVLNAVWALLFCNMMAWQALKKSASAFVLQLLTAKSN